MSNSIAPFVAGTTAYARNSGSITVGELAIGSTVAGLGDPLLDRTILTGINVNEGIITTGDNSAGMTASGMNTMVLNTGTITTGSFDISAYLPGKYSAGQFAELRAGASASSWRYAEMINYGTITVGDGKIGAVARSANSGIGYTAACSRATRVLSLPVTMPLARVSTAISSRSSPARARFRSVTIPSASKSPRATRFVYSGDTQPTHIPRCAAGIQQRNHRDRR